MALLRRTAFENLFRSFRRTAFHLELKDSYHIPEESEPLRRFLDGQPGDLGWHQPWLALVREVTATGRQITRVRVVTVPHSDYVRWGLTVTPLNIAAGEDIRWLPRDRAGDIPLPAEDFWLFDDERLVYTVFEPDGRFAGGREEPDPEAVARCRRASALAWARAVPHATYATV